MIGGLFSGPGDSELDPRNQAINLFGAAMLSGAGSGQNFSSILGNAVAQGQGAYGRAMDAKSKRDYVQSLMADQQAQADQRRAAVAELQRKATAAKQLQAAQRAFWAKAGGIGGGGGMPAAPGAQAAPQPMGGGMMPQQPAAAPAGGGGTQITPAMFAEAQMLGIEPATLKSMAEAQDWGRATVARLAQTRDGQGRPVQQQLDQFGRPVGAPLAPEYKPQMVNQGDRQTLVDLNSARDGQSFGMNMSPGERDASARGWAGVNNQRERLQFEQQQAKAAAEAGRWTNDLERGVQVSTTTGETRPITAGGVPIGAKPKDLNDAQSKALLFGSRAQAANAAFDEAAKTPKESKFSGASDRPGWWKRTAEGVAGGVPVVGETLSQGVGALFNVTQSDAQQQAEQAQRDFVNAILRRESGAVISPSEFANARAQYFPAQGDSDKVLAQKARNRELAVQGILAEVPAAQRASLNAGSPPATPAAPPAAAQPSAGPKPKSRIVTLEDGTSVGAELGPDGNYYVGRGPNRQRVQE